MIDIKEYNLPDLVFSECNINAFKFWIPDKTYIVLGASNNPEESLNIENVVVDNIPVYKRNSGGQSVVITPKTIIISVVLFNKNYSKPKEIFQIINTEIIKSLQKLGINDLFHKGISDITINEKKILGSAINKKKEKIFYHAMLNYDQNPDILECYLKHPKKEPDYRKGRSHKNFVTSITESGYDISMFEIIESLKNTFCKFV